MRSFPLVYPWSLPDTPLLFAGPAPDSWPSFFPCNLIPPQRIPNTAFAANASAISDWYASGCSATCAFSFSGSIFRKLLCSSFFPKSPVSFSCFSHFCIVDLDTSKIWCVASKLCPVCLYSIVRSLYFLNSSFPHSTLFTTFFNCFYYTTYIFLSELCVLKSSPGCRVIRDCF